MRFLAVAAALLGCSSAPYAPCNGSCTAEELCVEVGGITCAPKCNQDAGTAQTDSGVCATGWSCGPAVTMYCEEPCTVSTADVCLPPPD
jgi:hypothetical protein